MSNTTKTARRLSDWLEANHSSYDAGPWPMAGGASTRTYWRIANSAGDRSAVVMALPEDPFASEERGGSSTEGIGPRQLPFVATARWLAELGLPVPAIYAVDLDSGFVVLEDLGDTRLFDVIEGGVGEATLLGHYRDALALLVRFQAAVVRAPPPWTPPRFGAEAMDAEALEFVEMGIEAHHGVSLSPTERGAVLADLASVRDGLLAVPYALAHRDFQSQNLMVTPGGLAMLDFQDAFVAPCVYDLVALLRDSYVVLSAEDLSRLLDHYHALRLSMGVAGDVLASRQVLGRLFALQTVQRKLKDAGRFVTLSRRGKPGFLRFYDDSIAYARAALASLEGLDALRAVLDRHAAPGSTTICPGT